MIEKKSPVKVAYFSMEFMLRTHIPTYAGGLGMLAGDLLRSCADMNVPAVGITLVYAGSTFNQVFLPDGTQSYQEIDYRKNDQFVKMPHEIKIIIDGQDVIVDCWRYDIVGYNEFVVPVFLLDTNHHENEPWMRHITENLYGGGDYARICQELVLGVGGIKMLREMGYEDVEQYHMNEGHAAFVPLALLPENDYKDEEVKKKCVFTTHTPIPEGHDIFPYEMAYKYCGVYFPWHIKQLAGEDSLSMTRLALSMSHFSFGVSQKHGELSREMFPDFKIGAITNGVHARTWISSTSQDLYNEFIPGWIENPDLLKEAPEKLPDDKLWETHQQNKGILVDFVNKHLTSITTEEEKLHPDKDQMFDTDTLTIALARRPVGYKRPLLIYRDLIRLIRIGAGRLQIIQAGKSHPADTNSQQLVSEILKYSKKLKGILRIVYLENYSPKIARMLVSGCDVWLNTPKRHLEASGTSGMKAVMNGVLNFSVLDGWWIEGYHMRPDAGFSIGPEPAELHPQNDDNKDGEDMYSKLEDVIIPMYYNNRKEWVRRMKQSITLGAYFNTNRCIREYEKIAWKQTT
ncbi:MAG: alpha-glucan family phosphorylase [Candidatus Roizmanbacteria bacterium]